MRYPTSRAQPATSAYGKDLVPPASSHAANLVVQAKSCLCVSACVSCTPRDLCWSVAEAATMLLFMSTKGILVEERVDCLSVKMCVLGGRGRLKAGANHGAQNHEHHSRRVHGSRCHNVIKRASSGAHLCAGFAPFASRGSAFCHGRSLLVCAYVGT